MAGRRRKYATQTVGDTYTTLITANIEEAGNGSFDRVSFTFQCDTEQRATFRVQGRARTDDDASRWVDVDTCASRSSNDEPDAIRSTFYDFADYRIQAKSDSASTDATVSAWYRRDTDGD